MMLLLISKQCSTEAKAVAVNPLFIHDGKQFECFSGEEIHQAA